MWDLKRLLRYLQDYELLYNARQLLIKSYGVDNAISSSGKI